MKKSILAVAVFSTFNTWLELSNRAIRTKK